MCLRHVRSCNSYSLGDHIYLSHEWTRDHASVVFSGFDVADNRVFSGIGLPTKVVDNQSYS